MTAKSKKIPIKNVTRMDWRARRLAEYYNDLEANRLQADRVAYLRGMGDGVRLERKKKSTYRAQGVCLGICITAIIISIITLI